MPGIFVGIDVSQAALDVRVLPADVGGRFDNTPAGHRELADFLRPFAAAPAEIRAVLESTGGLELPAALALEAAGFEVAIIKPNAPVTTPRPPADSPRPTPASSRSSPEPCR